MSFVMQLKTWNSHAFLKTYTTGFIKKTLVLQLHFRVLFHVFVGIYLINQVSSHSLFFSHFQII